MTIPDGVTNIEYKAFSGCSGLTSVTIPDGVTSIGSGSFSGCSSLVRVTIPASVTDISTPGISNESAFFGCSALKEIVVDAANPNYKSVNGLLLSKDGKTLIQGVNGDVTIPDGVAKIGPGAFSGCGGLTRVRIPSSVTDIAELDEIFANWVGGSPIPAFYDCSGLTEIVVDAANPNYKSVNGLLLSKDGKTLLQGVNGDVTIPDGVTTIGRWAFRGCSGLTRVTIPSSVTGIAKVDVSEDMYYDHNHVNHFWADYPRGSTPAFLGCVGLTEISVDAANPVYKSVNGLLLSKDGKVLIQGVNGSVTIPDGVMRIREKAFYDCKGLTRVTLPDSLTYIEDDAFSGCGGLTEIVVGEGNPVYKSVNGFLLSKDGTALIQGINGDVTIPDGVTRIYEYAFSGYSGLTCVTIPDSVTYIGYGAFADPTILTHIIFKGNAPVNDDWLGAHDGYCHFPDECCLYVPRGSTGWGVSIPGTWNGLRIEYLEDASPDIWTVTFDANGGELADGDSSRQVEDGTSLGELPAPSRLDYTFLGWFTAAEGGEQISSVTIITGDATYYAHWTGTPRPPDPVPEPIWTIDSNGVLTAVDLNGCADIVIPNSVTSIGDSAFYECSGFTSVTIPDSVTSIGNLAFSGCIGLTSVTIPDSVTSIGASAFNDCSGLTNISVGAGNANYKSVNGLLLSKDGKTLVHGVNGDVLIPDSVTSIGDGAFSGCSGLTSVTIPDGVTYIGTLAFRACSGLTSVTIPDSVMSIGDRAFSGCTNLTSVTIPDSVTSIGGYAFLNCSGLTSVHITDLAKWCGISFGNSYANPLYYAHDLYLNGEKVTALTIPNSVTSIGQDAFSCCSGLTSVTIPNSVTSIGVGAFYGCNGLTSVTIPDSVTSIGGEAFEYCSGLLSFSVAADNPSYKSVSGLLLTKDGETLVAGLNGDVTIPDSVTSIGGRAFYGCSGLTSVTIPNSVSSIGYRAFSGCTNLTSVTIPDSVTSIEFEAFEGCSCLTSVTIGNGVTNIGYGAFWYCDGLMSFTVDNGNANYSSLNGLLLSKDGKTLIRGVNGAVAIPDSVTSIGDSAFWNCSGLTSVTIPDSVTNIGWGAFADCSGLTSVTIPGSVTYIDVDTFEGCSGLTSVTIPNGVTSIADYAFSLCTNLTDVTIPKSVTHISSNNTFRGTKLATVHVEVGDTDRVKSLLSGSELDVSGITFIEDVVPEPLAPASDGLAAWLAERNLRADARAANGRTATECYALGLDPTDATNDFRIVSIEMVDGKPKVEWEPKVNRWTGAEIQAVLKGAATLDGEWKAVEEATAAEKAAMRFFKVVVE